MFHSNAKVQFYDTKNAQHGSALNGPWHLRSVKGNRIGKPTEMYDILSYIKLLLCAFKSQGARPISTWGIFITLTNVR